MHFRMDWFLFALAMHITMCLLVGLLYGAMLPLLPTRPILLGGIIGPLLWTGLLYHILGFVNPLLDQRINWWWFAAIASWLWRSRRTGGGAANQGLDRGEHAAGHASRHRGSRPDARARRRGQEAMKRSPRTCACFAGCAAVVGRMQLPGKPTPSDIVRRPTDILDPVALYNQNCAGCHGADGKLGPAPPIGDPVYLAVVDDDALRNAISKGRPGTAMSAFAQSEGGMLTEQAGQCHRSGHAPTLGTAADSAGRRGSALRSQGAGQCSAGSGGVCDLLRLLSRSGWQGNGRRSAPS